MPLLKNSNGGMLHDIMPETENHLNQAPAAGYIGFDPTANSLHIGSWCKF